MSAKKDKKEKKKYKQEGEDEEGEDGREIKLSLTKKQGKLKSFIMLTNDKWQMNAETPSSNAFAEDFIPLTPLCKSTQVFYFKMVSLSFIFCYLGFSHLGHQWM